MRRTRPFSAPALLLLALAPAAASAQASIVRRTTAPAVVRVRAINATTWTVFASGYDTTTLGLGVTWTGAGFKIPASSPITAVNSVRLFEEVSSASVNHVEWSSSTAIGTSFNAVQAGTWVGFLGQAAGPDAGGKQVGLLFEVTVSSGTTFAQLSTTLQQAVIGIDSATFGGDLENRGRHLLTPTSVLENTADANAKIFHNALHTSGSTRPTTTAADWLYFMQPQAFRFGQGAATGWRVELQDGEQATAESVDVGYVRYSNDNLTPDITAAGLLTSVTYQLFGAGSGTANVLWTLTTAGPIDVGSYSGVRLVLPKPRSATDLVTVSTQDGTSLKTPANLIAQWTYSGQSLVANYRSAGTTLLAGGLYDMPALHAFSRSTAYTSPAEDLLGPEGLFFSTSRADAVGWRITSKRYADEYAVICLAAKYISTPILTPWRYLLIDNIVLSGFPFKLDAQGVGVTPTSPLPVGLTLSSQAILFRLSNINDALFTDACTVRSY